MKKYLLLFTVAMTLFACESNTDVKEDIESLRKERTTLQNENAWLRDTKSTKESEIATLDEHLEESHIYQSGRTPKYVLGIKLEQSHFTLDITEHAKDAMNAIEFEIPVDKDYYNSVSVGEEIVDDFRVGSFIFNGSLGDWEMTVEHKHVR
jgi:hypothetical protein